MFTRSFWKDLAERAIKTASQAIAGALVGFTVGQDWKPAVLAAAVTTLASIFTSLASAPLGSSGTASAVTLATDSDK